MFSNLYVRPSVQKIIQFYGVPVHIPSKYIESVVFYSWPVSPMTKGVEETMFCLIEIQSENIKMTWNIIYLFKSFYFCSYDF